MLRNIDKPDPLDAYLPTEEQIAAAMAKIRAEWPEHRFLPGGQKSKPRPYLPRLCAYRGDLPYVE